MKVKGIHCSSCKSLIEDVCREAEGVTGCTVDEKTGNTVITHSRPLDTGRIKKEIESIGSYNVEIVK